MRFRRILLDFSLHPLNAVISNRIDRMAKTAKIIPITSLRTRYVDAIVASGLVDGIEDISALDPRPYRYSEGDFICRRGESAKSLWVIVTGSVSVKDGNRTLFIR